MNKTMAAIIVGCLSILIVVSGCKTTNPGNSHGWSLDGLMGRSADKPIDPEDQFDVFGDRNPDRISLNDLGPGRIGTTLATRFGKQSQQLAESQFKEAQAIYDRALAGWDKKNVSDETVQEFRQAAKQFQVAASNWPDSAMQQDALFMQGEAHFFANEYVLANRAYEILINKYSGTSKLDLVESRRFEIAQYWLDLARSDAGLKFNDASRPVRDLSGQARRILHRIRLDDPTGKLADDATLALANAFYEAKQYADAADAYEDLRRTFPGSTHQYHAHLFELRARLAAYRGPSYDGTDLHKAEQLMKTILKQFPDKIDEHRESLAKEATSIRDMLAERDWSLGEYYEKRGENRAAGFYYSQVAKKFSDSKYAGDAKQRVASLGQMQPIPEQKAQWLVDLFPMKERNKPLIATGDRESILR